MANSSPPQEYPPPFMEKYTSFISKRGVGFVEKSRIKCSRCEGNPQGCYQCTGGYIQFACADWKSIMKMCSVRLVQLGCECKTKNFSLHCIFYNEQRVLCIPFHVNIFTSATSDDEYVVEFQRRRSGDIYEFMDLYANFIQQDRGCGLVDRSKTGNFLTPRQNFVAESWEPVRVTSEVLECLMGLLKSEYFDVCAEGLTQLAKCVQKDANRIVMSQYPSMVSILLALLDDDFDSIIYPTLIIFKFLIRPDTELTAEEQKQLSCKLDSLLAKNLGETYQLLITSVLKSVGGVGPEPHATKTS